MTRHSKNSTAGAFFTSAEREQLSYGTCAQRLGRDSLRKPDSCHICLQPARDAVVCSLGHLFCRECILTALLTQLQQQAIKQKAYERQQAHQQNEERLQAAETQRKRILDFERLSSETDTFAKKVKPTEELNAFWVPSKIPQAKVILAPPKKETTCPVSDHPVNIKKLIPVVWHKNSQGISTCLLCEKEITNVTRIVLFRHCGHVFCQKCHQELLITSTKDVTVEGGRKAGLGLGLGLGRCPDCGSICETPNDVIQLSFDGTGFANNGGNVQVTRYNPAFI